MLGARALIAARLGLGKRLAGTPTGLTRRQCLRSLPKATYASGQGLAYGGENEIEIRAVVCRNFGGPEVMCIEKKTLPPPGPGQIRVKVGAAGINPSDTYILLGPDGPYAGTKLVPELPFTPGKDGAGVIEAVGPGVGPPFRKGERVYMSGSLTGMFAEYTLCDKATVYQLPNNVTLPEGAGVGVPCATAHRALFTRCGAKEGDAVFVHGASGAVGLAAVQLAVGSGCYPVVGTAGTTAGEDAVRAAGAHTVINHRSSHYLETAKNVKPSGYDICLEMMASSNLSADLSIMGKYGRVAIIGSKAIPTTINPRSCMPLELDIRGVFLGNATTEELAQTHGALYSALASSVLVPPVASQFPLEQAAAAFTEVTTPTQGGSSGNVVIIIE
ncbi:hypothetical protein CYMTET_36108 [Cymbomonas tetramitiformis]|uniref:Enoyl reductase (ER) domain-containing protein n=1 Tax=Cymbomonas tetramitiformis TaxID=36881 RepID=A0AAE0CIQ2_9CHLO|nr:hypothetical protein CYMTET_36108 [Cymbomonas tetramitiformis]